MIPQKLIDLYKQAKQIHVDAITANVEIEQLIRSSADERDLTDIAFALREIENLVEDTRTRSYILRKIAEKLVAALVVANGECNIKTEYVTASVKSSTMVAIPDHKKNPEHYKQMMAYLGVPEHLITLVKPIWLELLSFLASQQEQGKPMPPGVDVNKTWVEYSLRMHSRVKPDGTPTRQTKEELQTEEIPF